MNEAHYLKDELFARISKNPDIFEFLQSGSLDGLWYWDLENPENEWMNAQFWELLGYDPKEKKHLTREWQDLINPDDLREAKDNLQKHCADPSHPYDQIVRYRHKNGRTIWVRCRGIAIRDEDGKPIRMLGAHNDLTEQKESEEALREQLDFSESLIETAQAIILVLNPQGRIVRFNSYMEELVGYDLDEVKGKDWFETFVKQENGSTVKCLFQKALDDIQTSGNETPIIAKDGRTILVEWYDKTLKDKDGRTVGVLAIGYDITERKQAEKEREKLQAQLLQAQKMESVGRLAGGVAHDFNNMLGVILGHIEMALEDVDPAVPLHNSLQAVQYAAKRSSALTRQLLAFARKQTVAPKVIDINHTVEGMLKMLRRLIGEDINLLWQPGGNLRPIKVDPSQLDQLLANLCVNARDAIAGVGKITIETDAKTFDETYCADHLGFLPGEYVLLEVSDDGCGMDKKTLNQIFEPFFTTKAQGQGTGLGLASVFGMVKQNNGFINVYSEPGQGTTFKIYLPAYAIQSDGVMEKAPDLTTEHGNETILLVEDETTILEMTTMMLEKLGYTVVAANTPGEAIRLAHEYQGRLDLLMTDVVMPEMNGRELAGNLLTHYPDLKRLFMSGYTANVIAHHGVLDEGVHFIQKPFSMRDLGRKLRKALESRHVH